MDPTFIAIAFACGLAVYLIKLPPLIVFLAAGLVLNAIIALALSFVVSAPLNSHNENIYRKNHDAFSA